jgi:hypothetical protein
VKLLNILLFTLSIFLISCSSSSTDNNNKTIKKIDAMDLEKEIKENAIAAELKYLDKRIIVTNCILKGTEKLKNRDYDDQYCVKVKTKVWDHIFFLRDDQIQTATQLKTDQLIRVSGLVVQVDAFGFIRMEDCRILLNENGSSIWEYDKTETSYWKMREEQKQAQLKEQLEREKAEMKMLETKAEEERKLSDDKDEVLNNISKQADENESEDAEALRLQEEYYNSQTEERLKWETDQEEKEKLEMNDSINFK